MPAWFKIEMVPLSFNAAMFVAYLCEFEQPGKILYWLGATILTGGLLFMRG
jgi:hypothetical protein